MSLFTIKFIEFFSRMVTFYFEKLTVCLVSHSCRNDTKVQVVISGNISLVFASFDKFGMLSDA